MPYITREDGERFIIPSYRDVLSAKKPTLLRREILLLCSSYGEYICLLRKNADQYEVAFSPDPGYLLGESIWHNFKRPLDLVYCEAIPNTSEAILVIVKAGIVYLDGSFPLDAIFDELVIFRTQQNNFDIYIQGDVPISQAPEEGKFSFDSSSVKSFSVLDKPIFPTLPVVKTFQLQLVETVLKAKGIGIFPLKKILTVCVVIGLLWMAWSYLSTHRKQLPQVVIRATNPYQLYLTTMTAPDPAEQVEWISRLLWKFTTIPGWTIDSIDFTNGLLRASVKSLGARTNILYDWADQNGAKVEVGQTGFFITITTQFEVRQPPTTISLLNDVVSKMIDSMSYVIPGNNLTIGTTIDRGKFGERQITISFNDVTPTTLNLIGQQLKNMPLVLTKVSIKIDGGNVSGTIILRALGN